MSGSRRARRDQESRSLNGDRELLQRVCERHETYDHCKQNAEHAGDCSPLQIALDLTRPIVHAAIRCSPAPLARHTTGSNECNIRAATARDGSQRPVTDSHRQHRLAPHRDTRAAGCVDFSACSL